jgi:hypothetical protein
MALRGVDLDTCLFYGTMVDDIRRAPSGGRKEKDKHGSVE